MKKFLFVLLILLLGFGGYIIYTNYINKGIPKLTLEEEIVNIDELTIYGTHLNLHGNLVNDDNLDLVLYNGEFKSYKINNDSDGFNLSEYINDGMYLEDILPGTYYLYLRSSHKDEKDKDVYKYYGLNNTTDYKETIYYTFNVNGNKIVIDSDEEYSSIRFTVTENTDNEIYDIVIDPGHGGMDSGANKNGKREADYTMKIATKLKKLLEDKGLKVKLTREDGQLSNNEVLPDYGKGGRAVINHEVHAKYLFSIHLNSNASTGVHGLEVYTPANINYDFAKNLVSNIISETGTSYSTNKISKVDNGIYTRTFSEYDIKNSLKEYETKKLNAYDLSTKSNYYFMIRETGGIMTGAYVDNRNEPKIIGNPYYNSNVGSEAYLLELAYLTNIDDINNVDNNMDKYCEAIAKTFLSTYMPKN